MSYCRWSSNNFNCDIYAYESEFGYQIHVADNRVVGEIPKLQHPTDWKDKTQRELFAQSHRDQMAFLDKCERRKIGLPEDGKTFLFSSLENFRDKLSELRKMGYNFPDYVFEEIEAEITFKKSTNMKQLDYTVFPSTEKTIRVQEDADYGGAHRYLIQNSIGFKDGKAEYVPESVQAIQFVQKNLDGSVIPGVQSEQLAYILLDRCQKLNARFPSEQNLKMIEGLNMFLEACKERVEDRISRGVMGDLKK